VILILQFDGADATVDMVSSAVHDFRGADDVVALELKGFMLFNSEDGRKMSIADCGGIACLNFSWHEACMIVNWNRQHVNGTKILQSIYERSEGSFTVQRHFTHRIMG